MSKKKKLKIPKPRDLVAKEMLLSGKFKQKVIPNKKKNWKSKNWKAELRKDSASSLLKRNKFKKRILKCVGKSKQKMENFIRLKMLLWMQALMKRKAFIL